MEAGNQIHTIEIQGIARAGNESASKDGFCNEVIGLEMKEGSLTPYAPNPTIIDVTKYIKGWVHKTTTQINHVFLDADKKLYWISDADARDGKDAEYLCDIKGDNVEFVGNVISLGNNKEFCIFRNDKYFYIDEDDLRLDIDVFLADSGLVAKCKMGASADKESSDIPMEMMKSKGGVVLTAGDKLRNEVKQAGFYKGGISFCRYALRLYNGSHVSISQPFILSDIPVGKINSADIEAMPVNTVSAAAYASSNNTVETTYTNIKNTDGTREYVQSYKYPRKIYTRVKNLDDSYTYTLREVGYPITGKYVLMDFSAYQTNIPIVTGDPVDTKDGYDVYEQLQYVIKDGINPKIGDVFVMHTGIAYTDTDKDDTYHEGMKINDVELDAEVDDGYQKDVESEFADYDRESVPCTHARCMITDEPAPYFGICVYNSDDESGAITMIRQLHTLGYELKESIPEEFKGFILGVDFYMTTPVSPYVYEAEAESNDDRIEDEYTTGSLNDFSGGWDNTYVDAIIPKCKNMQDLKEELEKSLSTFYLCARIDYDDLVDKTINKPYRFPNDRRMFANYETQSILDQSVVNQRMDYNISKIYNSRVNAADVTYNTETMTPGSSVAYPRSERSYNAAFFTMHIYDFSKLEGARVEIPFNEATYQQKQFLLHYGIGIINQPNAITKDEADSTPHDYSMLHIVNSSLSDRSSGSIYSFTKLIDYVYVFIVHTNNNVKETVSYVTLRRDDARFPIYLNMMLYPANNGEDIRLLVVQNAWNDTGKKMITTYSLFNRDFKLNKIDTTIFSTYISSSSDGDTNKYTHDFHYAETSNPVDSDSVSFTKEPAISIEDYLATKDIEITHEEVQEKNYIFSSEAGEPMSFNTADIKKVGDGEIRAFGVMTAAISQGQFGAYSLYVFSSDGIWALPVDTTGTRAFGSPAPVSRDVISENACLVELDDSIAFATKKGLMVIRGQEGKLLSEIVNGEPHPLPHQTVYHAGDGQYVLYLAGTKVVSLGKAVSYEDFREYINMADTKMSYLYSKSKILIYNKTMDYVYIYDMSDNITTKLALKIAFDNGDYPEPLAAIVDGTSKTYKLFDYDGSKEPVDTLIQTRPIKVIPDEMSSSYRVAWRGRFINASDEKPLGIYVMGSNDCEKWMYVGGSEYKPCDEVYHDIGTTVERFTCKYVMVVFAGQLADGSKIDDLNIASNTKYRNKIR